MSIPKTPKRRHFADQEEIDIDIPDGDPLLGKALYDIHCAGCHNLNENNNMGPRLRDVYLRKAGSLKNYYYSKIMKGASFRWTKNRLFLFLEDPESMIPDTQMSFEGIQDPWTRACIIEYLHFLKDQKKA